MKKIVSLLLAALMLMSVVPLAASAACAHENTTYHQKTNWVCDVPGYTAGICCFMRYWYCSSFCCQSAICLFPKACSANF